MPSYVVWITYRGAGGSDGYDYTARAPDLATAKRRAKRYAEREAERTGNRVSVKVESLKDYNSRVHGGR
jgi:hypothetical protein